MLLPAAALYGGLTAACACRFLFGMATGPSLPSAANVVATWALPKEKGMGTSVTFTGIPPTRE